MKLGVVVGHTKNKPGAFSETMNVHEYKWNSDLGKKIEPHANANLEIKTFFRDGHGIAGAYREADQWGADLTVELHFNSSDNVTATGTGVLYFPGSARGRRWAGLLRDQIGQVLGLPDWPRGTGGVVTPFQASGVQERGKASLGAGRAPAALIEPFFGSNPNDCAVASAEKGALARAIAAAAGRFS